MSCARPLSAFKLADGGIHWSERAGFDYVGRQDLPCGQCAGCRRKRAAELTTRLVHEGQMHRESICPTLTYAPEKLPAHGSVSRSHLEEFFKRVRERRARVDGVRAVCHGMAEYSPEKLRPHYHVGIFGWRPADAEFWSRSETGAAQWESAELTSLWGHGQVVFQDWSDGAAAYCAKHQAAKLTGPLGEAQRAVLGASGEVVGFREPEFEVRPRRPGLGLSFFAKYHEQMLLLGFTVVGGREVPLPEYYLRVADRFAPGRASELRAAYASQQWRAELARLQSGQALESSPGRLAAREACALAEIERLRGKEFRHG